MPRKLAAGTVLFRLSDALEVLLVHPSGAFHAATPWGLPKGEPNPRESLEAAARRETREETGVVAGALVDLGYVDYKKTKKRVHAFAGLAPAGCVPRCASWEVDRSEFVELDRALELIHPDQRPLVERAKEIYDRGELAAGG